MKTFTIQKWDRVGIGHSEGEIIDVGPKEVRVAVRNPRCPHETTIPIHALVWEEKEQRWEIEEDNDQRPRGRV